VHRRSAPKVRDGRRVQKQNNWVVHEGDYYVRVQDEIASTAAIQASARAT
jgi:hypothetical protein